MSKKLTIAALKRMDSKTYNGKREIDINGYSLVIDEVFRPTKIDELIAEFLDKVIYVTEKDIVFDNWFEYILLLMVRHFTSLEIPNDFESQVAAWKLLIDNNCFSPIAEAFDKEETKKIFDAISQRNDLLDHVAQEVAAQVKETAEGE